ncbi:MAG: TIGR02099 family protein [Betaproteobacteria bacterium]|nr:MAG: TIGR02099 family protein [Betaproteobacteria bacterium]
MRRLHHRLLHGLYYLIGITVIVMAGITLFLRAVVIPEIASYRADIERVVSRSLGMPVKIASVSGRWQGIHPQFSLTQLSITAADGRLLLTLPEARASVSWQSLLVANLRLATLEIHGLDLLAQRDATGLIRVAGIPINTPEASSGVPDWVLDQPRITLRNGRLTWQDDLIKAPTLVISDIHAQLESTLLNRHRFGLKARLPTGLGERLDLRADLHGRDLAKREHWRGEIYAAVKNTHLDSLALHTPWSQKFIQNGTGQVRAWIDLKKGGVEAVTGDIHLSDTHVRFADDLPETLFTALKGRVAWQREGDDEELSARGLTFATPNQSASEPADLRLKISRDPKTHRIHGGEIETRNLRIETFTTLTGNLPMPRAIHEQIQALAPRGQIAYASGRWHENAPHANGPRKDTHRLNVRFTGLGINATRTQPGFENASGTLEGNEAGGRLAITSEGFKLDMPTVFHERIDLHTLDGSLRWQPHQDGYAVRIERLHLANADLDGQLEGQITFAPGRAPVADLKAQLKHGHGPAVWRYLPKTVGDDTRLWLKDSLKAGDSHNARMVLKGPLDRFPFSKGGGEFRVTVPLKDGILHYAADWPHIEAIQGEILFDRARMSVKATGRTAGTQLTEVSVRINDLFNPTTLLEIDGKASGETAAFIHFVNHSPVKASSGGFTNDLIAKGNALLQLKLRLPLERMEESLVNGDLTLKDNLITPGRGLPTVEHLNGTLRFTQDTFHGHNLNARLYGEAAALTITPREAGAMLVRVNSRLNKNLLSAWMPPELAPYIKGQTAYQLDLVIDANRQKLEVSSNLEGIAIDLPEPFGKPAHTRIQTHLESAPEEAGYHTLKVKYGQIASLRALYKDNLASARIGVRIGSGEIKTPEKPGIHITGAIPRIDLDQWRTLASASTPSTSPRLTIHEIDLAYTKLLVLDRAIAAGRITLSPNAEGWTITLKSTEIDGGITLKERPKPYILVTLDKLHLTKGETARAPSPPTNNEINRYSGSVHIKDLVIGDAKLGKIDFNFKPTAHGYAIGELKLEQPHATLLGRINLSNHPSHPSILEDATIEIKHLDKLMHQLGYPGRIKGGAGTLSSRRIIWTGGLDKLSPNAVSGSLSLNLEKGRFLEMDPGIARLFGLINLQSISRLSLLDKGEMFAKGFAFDTVKADAQLSSGHVTLNPLVIDGPSAKVEMRGTIDLKAETQTLALEIEPHVTDTLVAASGLAGGPVGFVGAWLASKAFERQISAATPRVEYDVSGTWDKPIVTPKNTKKSNTAVEKPYDLLTQ